MEEPKKQQPGQLNIELPAEIAKGAYSNLAVISHSDAEFILDFIQIIPGTQKAEVRSRIIMTPQHAKRLLMAMNENIEKYERSFGPIRTPQRDVELPPNFGGPTGYA